jgi:glycosyltransferase involved in cell wall biosynthesis
MTSSETAPENPRVEQLKKRLASRVQKNRKLLEIVRKLRSSLKNAGAKAETHKLNGPVNRYLRFSQLAADAAEELAADVAVAHGVQSLPAAWMVAKQTGARLFCDVIEIPSFHDRVLTRNWHVTNTEFLDCAFEGYLRKCHGLLTIGPTLGKAISHYGPPVTVVQNYRYAETPKRSGRLREMCKLSEGDRLVLTMSKTVHGLEEVVHALELLPDDIHLATLGRPHPQSYEDTINALIAERGLARRVHIFDQVPYEELTSVASGADGGLIVRDPAIRNNYVSLPNRIFDYMFSGVPVCVSAEIPDIVSVVTEWDMGALVDTLTPVGWAGAIDTVLRRSEEMRLNALRAAQALTWESREPVLFEALGYPRSVTYFGMIDLRGNNRTMRMAKSFAGYGTKVSICCVGKTPPTETEAQRYHFHIFDA